MTIVPSGVLRGPMKRTNRKMVPVLYIAEIAQRPAVVDVPMDRGHIALFSNNPIWRAETHGSRFLVFNAILNFDSLNAGRKLDEK